MLILSLVFLPSYGRDRLPDALVEYVPGRCFATVQREFCITGARLRWSDLAASGCTPGQVFQKRNSQRPFPTGLWLSREPAINLGSSSTRQTNRPCCCEVSLGLIGSITWFFDGVKQSTLVTPLTTRTAVSVLTGRTVSKSTTCSRTARCGVRCWRHILASDSSALAAATDRLGSLMQRSTYRNTGSARPTKHKTDRPIPFSDFLFGSLVFL